MQAHPIYHAALPIFQEAILELLEAWRSRLSQLPKRPFTDFVKINGIELMMSPWDPDFRIVFRPTESTIRPRMGLASRAMLATGAYDESSPNGQEFDVVARDRALDFMAHVYSDKSIERRKPRDVAHLLFLAAAEAFISSATTEKLISIGIDAPFVGNDFIAGEFEYMLYDDDKSTTCNYCEHVLLNAITGYMSSTAGKLGLPCTTP